MNSFNHYSLGAIGKWLYSGPGGINIDEEHPGWKHFFLAPEFSTRFTSYRASFDSPYGVISSGWRIENGTVSYDVTVPANSSATLSLPASGRDLKVSGDPVEPGENGAWVLPAGTYNFTFPVADIK
jgi:alpha-L-rhamnosidase